MKNIRVYIYIYIYIFIYIYIYIYIYIWARVGGVVDPSPSPRYTPFPQLPAFPSLGIPSACPDRFPRRLSG